MPGYSDRSLPQKLGIKADSRILPIAAPEGYSEILGELPPGARLAWRAGKSIDLAHVFAVREAELRHHLSALRRQLRPDAVVWVSWPKKAAKVPTDITDMWSGLKLVVRKRLRPADSDRMP